jgi:hypothetical protein
MITCQIHKIHPEIKCSIPAYSLSNPVCILHSASEPKDEIAVKEAVIKKLELDDYNFSKVWFDRPVSFAGIEFKNKVVFSKALFSGEADFRNSVFNEGADFDGVSFKGGVNFSNALFDGDVAFRKARFSKDVYFIKNSFKEVDFCEAIFDGGGEVDFEKVSFDYANFRNANFLTKTIFDNVHFGKGANFSNAEFNSDIKFLFSFFSGEANFRFAKVSGSIIFQSIFDIGSRWDENVPFKGDFSNIELKDRALLRFQDLSLGNVKFYNSNIKMMEFRNVEWRFQKNLLHGRHILYDEMLLSDPDSYVYAEANRHSIPHNKKEYMAKIEELYRQLKINYFSEQNYKNVGDFHYGEMQMHRKASPWRRWVSWYSIYWSLSGYGERPLRALICLAIFLFGFSGTVWDVGLYVNDYGNYAGFGDSLVFILQKASLQRPEWPMPANFWARILSSLSVLLLPGQAALFILSLRNRLGRRR